MFQNAGNDSIYGKLYEKNMDGLNSFFEVEDGLESIAKKDFFAMIYNNPIHSYEKYHCKVKINQNHGTYCKSLIKS